MDITIKIPVKKHIYRFLIANYGSSYRLCTKDFIGIMIFNYLKHPVQSTDNENRIEDYPLNYQILIPETYFFDYKVQIICPTAVIMFNNFFDSLMKFTFLLQVESLMKTPPKEMIQAYDQFIDQFVWDESKEPYSEYERQLGTLKKYHYRFRKNGKSLKFPVL